MPDLLIDTNILVLHIVGSWDRAAVPRHRRTAVFTPDDFDLLQAELAAYERLKTTASVLTEASNLMGNDFHRIVAETFGRTCGSLIEVLRPKDEIIAWLGFERLGFSDASILAALDHRTTVLTDDVHLYNQALYQGNQAINFNHLRRFPS
jgi:hypothetical protein